MRNGYTTGATACAAAVASCVFKLSNRIIETADILLPNGTPAHIPVHRDIDFFYGVKNGGDDVDVTHGMRIYADCVLNDTGDIEVTGGQGIGIVTKKGLQVPVGRYAINPAPEKMIKENLKRLLGDRGAKVTIWAPDGERIAKETFNEKVGVVGGISIIGTTGIVTPMSVEAIIETIKCETDVAAAEQKETICLTPGKIGEKHFLKKYPHISVILMSNFAHEAFDYASKKGFNRLYVAGHPAKLCKILMGYYNTHSKNSPMATDWLADRLELKEKFNTVEEILTSVDIDLSFLAGELAEKIEKDYGFAHVSVIFYDMNGGEKGARL